VVSVELTLAEIDALLMMKASAMFWLGMNDHERMNYKFARDALNDAYNAATGHNSEEYKR